MTLLYQVQDPNFFKGVIWVVVWFAVGIIYFALIGRTQAHPLARGRVRAGAQGQGLMADA